MLASERNPEDAPKPCTRCACCGKVLGHNHEVIRSRDLATNHERTELYCTPCANALWEALG